jgi:hypothetical protein
LQTAIERQRRTKKERKIEEEDTFRQHHAVQKVGIILIVDY